MAPAGAMLRRSFSSVFLPVRLWRNYLYLFFSRGFRNCWQKIFFASFEIKMKGKKTEEKDKFRKLIAFFPKHRKLPKNIVMKGYP